MTHLTLFDDYGPVITIEEEIKMTWLDLYNFLYAHANDNGKLDEMCKFWNQKVVIYNNKTKNEYTCKTKIINDKLVLGINDE